MSDSAAPRPYECTGATTTLVMLAWVRHPMVFVRSVNALTSPVPGPRRYAAGANVLLQVCSTGVVTREGRRPKPTPSSLLRNRVGVRYTPIDGSMNSLVMMSVAFRPSFGGVPREV